MADLAAYYYYRRLLFYYIDLTGKSSKGADRIADVIKRDITEVKRIYSKDKELSISKGDRTRMELFLKSPRLYGKTVGIYENIVIPLRQKLKRRSRHAF
jgi:hypothetical protein